jgi:predicted ATPase
MDEQDFRDAVRVRLRKVPVEDRSRWTDSNLYAWWLATQSGDSKLSVDNGRGKIWQSVRILVKDLIGPDAL